MTWKKKYLSTFLLAIIFFMLKPVASFAADEGIGFEISPIFPSSQIDPNKGYFYVQTSPGQEQTLEINVQNTSDDEITVKPIIENAVASTKGSIVYDKDIKLTDKSLKNPITEILTPNEESITIPAKKDKVITFTLKSPEDSYEGIKMGRIKIVKEKTEAEKTGLSMEYEYAIGVIASESGDLFNDGNKLNLVDVKATIHLGQRVVSAEIINPDPKTIEGLRVRSYVTKKGSDKKIKENNIDNFALPPNSKLNFLIPWGVTNFEAGDYVFHFNAENEYDSFSLKKEFTIRGNDAKKLNNDAAFKVITPTYIKIIIVVMNALLFVISFIIIKRNNTWVKELKSKKKGRNKKKRR